jgi:hypothetical protein
MPVKWRPVPGWPAYTISSSGELAGPRGKLKGHLLNSGYIGCTLNSGGVRRSTTVQRLVLEAFVGPAPSDGHEANHKNGIKTDNSPANLEWLTSAQNKAHAAEELGRKGGRPKTKVDPDLRKPGRLLIECNGQRFDIELRPDRRDCRRWYSFRDGEPFVHGGLEQVWREVQRQMAPLMSVRRLS